MVKGDTIFAGCQEGYVQVFDLETRTLVRTIIVQEVCQNILYIRSSKRSICLLEHRHIIVVHATLRALHLFLEWSDTGQCLDVVGISQYMNLCGFKRWSSTFNCTASWSAHEGIVLSSIITHSAQSNALVLVSGANDGFVKVSCLTRSFRPCITFHLVLGRRLAVKSDLCPAFGEQST